MDKPMMITREELYERIWKLPATKLAKELGISDVALAKICRKLSVPKPGPGHWRLVQLGWEIERPALPALVAGGAAEALIDPEPHRTRNGRSGAEACDGMPKYEVIPVPETLHRAHPIISRVRATLEAEKPAKGGLVTVPSGRSILRVSVSRAQTSRALRVMDALVKALERRGGRFVRSEGAGSERMCLEIDGQGVAFELTELVQKDDSYSWKYARWECAVTGRLQFRMFATEPKGARRCWADCKFYRLEEKVGEIVHWMFVTAEAERKARVALEERWRQWEAELKRKEDARRHQEEARRAKERKRRLEESWRSQLEESSEAWLRARRLRRFIRACGAVLQKAEGSLAAGDWQERWVAWAMAHADRLDPMTNGYLEAERQRLTASGGDQ
jgi:hypothetical protein